MIPVRCNWDTFSKSSLRGNIVAFRLVGYFIWNEEAAGSNPVYYTLMSRSSNCLGYHTFYVLIWVRNLCDLLSVRWCNG